MDKIAIYARISTIEQDVGMQLLALREYCQARKLNIYKEFIDAGFSGSNDSRPSLNELMSEARKKKFNTIIVYRFDRFARSSRHLITALEEFKNLGIEFISYSENIDTSSPLGKAIFVIVGAMAELERNIIVERVKSGLKAAKNRGKTLGRPKSIFDLNRLLKLKQEGNSIRTIANILGVSKTTIGKYLSPASCP